MKLINPLSPNDNYLYHYTTTKTAINYILPTGKLKFNSFSNVNDPRECKQWDISPVVRSNLNFDLKDFDAISEEISNILKSNAKLVCFSQDKEEAIEKWQPEALFDRGFARPNMWHHYSNAYNGICLMFDMKKLDSAFIKYFGNTRLISGPVRYTNKGILSNLKDDPFVIDLTNVYNANDYIRKIEIHRAKWLRQLFLQKLKDWSNEAEYRWIYFDNNPEPLYISFEDALKAIVIGYRVPENLTDDIYRFGVQYKAEVTNLHWRNGFPMIVHPAQPYITHKHLLLKGKAIDRQ